MLANRFRGSSRCLCRKQETTDRTFGIQLASVDCSPDPARSRRYLVAIRAWPAWGVRECPTKAICGPLGTETVVPRSSVSNLPHWPVIATGHVPNRQTEQPNCAVRRPVHPHDRRLVVPAVVSKPGSEDEPVAFLVGLVADAVLRLRRRISSQVCPPRCRDVVFLARSRQLFRSG
jgi:hypothetical protein